MVLGASLVWMVESTMCPVSAAWHGVLGRVVVADLADHDDVGVLPQHVLERAAEGDADLALHGDLVEVLVHHLEGVFEGDDVHPRAVHVLERAVQAWSSCRAGGPTTSSMPVEDSSMRR